MVVAKDEFEFDHEAFDRQMGVVQHEWFNQALGKPINVEALLDATKSLAGFCRAIPELLDRVGNLQEEIDRLEDEVDILEEDAADCDCDELESLRIEVKELLEDLSARDDEIDRLRDKIGEPGGEQ